MEIQGTDVYSGDTLTLEVKGGLIIRAGRSEPRPDLPYIGRGFLDMQVNGYRGIDYSGEGLAQADVARMVELLAPTGTTKHVPTIVTSGRDRILRNLETISRAAGSNPRLAAAIPGIHLEGPFISREDGPRGAHDARHVRDPSIGELEEWMAASSSLLKVVTLAPEMDGAVEFIRAGVRLGIAMAIGHTAATAEQIARAVDAGATLSTHLGNGSHAAVPRLRNYLWEQLAQDRLVAGIIADGFHLPESVLKVFARAKSLERLVLVSDVSFLAGSEPGVYRWGDVEVEVHPDRHLGLRGTPFLAGAGHLLDWDIAHFARAAGAGIGEAVQLATARPARVLGLPQPSQDFKEEEPADVVRFRYDLSGGPLDIVGVAFHGRTYP